jgi:hypothetical protein
MREYKLRIRARLDDTITVRANSRQEAEDSARNSYEHGEVPGDWLEDLVIDVLEEGAEVEPIKPQFAFPLIALSKPEEFVAEKWFPVMRAK